MVDEIMREMDLNNDGYLDYLEYALAKMKTRDESSKKHHKDNKNNEAKKQ